MLGLLLAAARVWGLRFSGFLLWGLAAALILSAALDRLAADRGGAWKAVRKGFYALAALGLIVLCCAEGFVISRGNRGSEGPPADAVIVLGAGVNGKTPSLVLRTRLEAALAYAKAHPDLPIAVTGGQGYGEELTEARCMYDWLVERGVDPRRLILEEAAASTSENFALSRPLLQASGVDVGEAVVAVVSNDFHLARAELLAERQGYGETVGVPAKLPWRHLSINYYLREAFGVLAVLTGLSG